jgi:hypothetical protein
VGTIGLLDLSGQSLDFRLRLVAARVAVDVFADRLDEAHADLRMRLDVIHLETGM